MLVQSSIRSNTAAAKLRRLSQVSRRYVTAARSAMAQHISPREAGADFIRIGPIGRDPMAADVRRADLQCPEAVHEFLDNALIVI
jgi:hypothetical protein